MPGLEDFDRYVDEHGIPEEDYPAAFARLEKVERGEPANAVVIEGDDLTAVGAGWTLTKVGERTAWIRPPTE